MSYKNIDIQWIICGEEAIDTVNAKGLDLAHGRDVTIGSIAMDSGIGMVSSNIDLKKASHTTSVIEDTLLQFDDIDKCSCVVK